VRQGLTQVEKIALPWARSWILTVRGRRTEVGGATSPPEAKIFGEKGSKRPFSLMILAVLEFCFCAFPQKGWTVLCVNEEEN
jgi:hypothetical protein